MTEEEKEAVEELKKESDKAPEDIGCVTNYIVVANKNVKTILNLIEKQQKEIKELLDE